MGIFLNGLLEPKISHTAHLVSSSKDHFLQFQILLPLVGPRYSPSPSVSIWHTPLPFLRYNPFPVTFVLPCSPVMIKPQLLMRVNQFLLVMESIRLTLVKILLLFSCCTPIEFFDIFIVMPFFSSYASTNLSSCELVKAITSSPCRSETVKRIAIHLQ